MNKHDIIQHTHALFVRDGTKPRLVGTCYPITDNCFITCAHVAREALDKLACMNNDSGFFLDSEKTNKQTWADNVFLARYRNAKSRYHLYAPILPPVDRKDMDFALLITRKAYSCSPSFPFVCDIRFDNDCETLENAANFSHGFPDDSAGETSDDCADWEIQTGGGASRSRNGRITELHIAHRNKPGCSGSPLFLKTSNGFAMAGLFRQIEANYSIVVTMDVFREFLSDTRVGKTPSREEKQWELLNEIAPIDDEQWKILKKMGSCTRWESCGSLHTLKRKRIISDPSQKNHTSRSTTFRIPPTTELAGTGASELARLSDRKQINDICDAITTHLADKATAQLPLAFVMPGPLRSHEGFHDRLADELTHRKKPRLSGWSNECMFIPRRVARVDALCRYKQCERALLATLRLDDTLVKTSWRDMVRKTFTELRGRYILWLQVDTQWLCNNSRCALQNWLTLWNSIDGYGIDLPVILLIYVEQHEKTRRKQCRPGLLKGIAHSLRLELSAEHHARALSRQRCGNIRCSCLDWLDHMTYHHASTWIDQVLEFIRDVDGDTFRDKVMSDWEEHQLMRWEHFCGYARGILTELLSQGVCIRSPYD